MKNLIVAIAVAILAFIGFGLVYGWIEYRRADDTTTIDIHTREIKEDVGVAADKAVAAGRKLIRKTTDAMESDDDTLPVTSPADDVVPRDDETSDGAKQPHHQDSDQP